MENRGRVLSVDFSNAVGRTVKASPLTAIDYGQILEIHGLPLPPSFECHFSKNGSTAFKSIGTTTDGVGSVPFIDEQTLSGGIITAYIYLHETADDGETEYRIIIPVESRPGVTPAEPTPVEQDVIAQAISALNNAVTTTNANVEITEANKNASAQSAEEAEADANRADTAWNGAVIAQNSAQASADVASTKATEASQSASTAHSEAQYAHSYAESAHTDAQSASASATSAQNSATSAQQSASLAQQYANTATAKASEAMQSAQSASTSAQTASQSAQSAQQSATQANTYATSASASAQSATASEASASASAESAQASADRAEQEADRWYDILPVDTATGSLAHFTDGAKDVPVKALSVSLEPVQSGSGDPSPDNVRPITGHTQVVVNRTGINVWDEEWELGMWNPAGQKAPSDRIIRCKNYISVLPSTQYYVYFPLAVYATGLILRELAEDYSFIRTVTKYTPATFTTGANTRYVVWCTYASDAITTYNNDVSINYPSTDHDYHPAQVQSITIPLGDTVYGGTLDVVNGVLTVDRAKIVLDGTQSIGVANWRAYEGSSVWLYVPSITPNRVNTVGRIGAVCDTLEEIPYGYNDAPIGDTYIYNGRIGFSSVGTSIYGLAVRVPVSGLTNASLINAYLAENPITIVYPITTPIEISLTPQQMTTLLGINNVWSDSGNVTVDYRADVQLYIQKMVAQALNA